MSAGEERVALVAGEGPWAPAMNEWRDSPRTMKQAADWANRWMPVLRRWDEKRRIALASERALSAQLAEALRELTSPGLLSGLPAALERAATALAAYDAASGGNK